MDTNLHTSSIVIDRSNHLEAMKDLEELTDIAIEGLLRAEALWLIKARHEMYEAINRGWVDKRGRPVEKFRIVIAPTRTSKGRLRLHFTCHTIIASRRVTPKAA